MPESESPIPEQQPEQMPALQTEIPFHPNWIVERKDEFKDSILKPRAESLYDTPQAMLTEDFLRKNYYEIHELISSGKVSKEEAAPLMARISGKIEADNRAREASSQVKEDEVFSQAFPELSEEEKSKMTIEERKSYAEKRSIEMAEEGKRVTLETERLRWIDVEYDQEFYARFTPNIEPRFYTEASSEQRKIWESRWRLARAAFFKKIASGVAGKLVENQDLIEFSTEDMERLYDQPGVKPALEWYADIIANNTEITLVDKNGKVKQTEDRDEKGKVKLDKDGNVIMRDRTTRIWKVRFGNDFEEIRERMRFDLRSKQGANLNEEQLKSADAIAWNWIFCGNLLESADSRYSYSGSRHENLASEICSDDLRAVFHPQEKYESKCWGNQIWGMFGRWGFEQITNIQKELKATKDDKVEFVPARNKSDYWQVDYEEQENGRIVIFAPECYPITTLKSFWEIYNFNKEETREVDGKLETKIIKKPYLQALLDKDKILWAESNVSNPWKTNYVTIRMVKAVKLFEHFSQGEAKTGWVARLEDYFTRLYLKEIVLDYYKEQELEVKGSSLKQGQSLNKEEKDQAERIANQAERIAKRKAGKHFHNIKVWAVYAARHGVGRPQTREVTDPYSSTITGQLIGWDRTTEEHNLRQAHRGNYLENGFFKKEKLVIESIK